MNALNFPALVAAIGGLTILVNLLTEVIKKATWSKLPTNFVVVLLSEGLTLAAGAAYAQINGAAVTWYAVVAAAVVGLLVAYSAMFGFDKLKEALGQIAVGEQAKTVSPLQLSSDAVAAAPAAAVGQRAQDAAATLADTDVIFQLEDDAYDGR